MVSRLGHKKTVDRLINDIGERFKSRQGGYTRIIKIGTRPGDRAEMALLEFVDYKPQAKSDLSPKDHKQKQKKLQKAKALHRKSIRKIQSESRIANRT